MKVTYKEKQPESVRYSTIKVGEVFIARGRLQIKTDCRGVNGVASIRLDTGVTYSYPELEMVVRADVELVVRS